MQTVHVRVNDAVTQQPTACRVRFTNAAGKFYAPLGRLADFPAHVSAFAEGNIFDGEHAYSYINGSCEIQLPPGAISVEIHKGLEYTPLKTTVQLAPGKLALRFVLERWTNARDDGWYSGDSRVYLASPHEYLLAAAAEDLAVVNLLAVETKIPSWASPLPAALPNIVAFSGQHPCLETPGHMVVVNTHNIHAELGSLGLLHCHRVVYPLSVAKGDIGWTLADWCDQCHRKAGLVVWTNDGTSRSRLSGEGLADLMLGKIDAFEIDRDDIYRFTDLIQDGLYTLWNAGLRVPLVGGSGSLSNAYLVGRPRTYCRFLPGEELTYRNWIEAVRAGRTYVTCGPLLSLAVDGRGPGDAVSLADEQRHVRVHAAARGPDVFEKLEVVHNGDVVASAGADQQAAPRTATLDQEVAVPDGGWLAVRCWGARGRLLAHSTPVYLDRPGNGVLRQSARQRLAAQLAELAAWAQRQEKKHERLLQVLHAAG